MGITSGTERLQGVANRLRQEGLAAADHVASELRSIEADAARASLSELSQCCRAAADALANLGTVAASDAQATDRLRRQVVELVDRALACAAPLAPGGGSAAAPGPAAAVGDAESERHFQETVGMFVTSAVGSLAELGEEILAVETGGDPAESIGAVRRIVHTLKAEFGVLGVTAAQQLCHQAETTIDAAVAAGLPFPTDRMLELVDVLERFVACLARDTRAQFPDVGSLLDGLRAAAVGVEPPAGADGGPRVKLEVGGEFADSLPEFITEARSHLGEAEAAMLALAGSPGNTEQINLTFRAFHTIKGVAGFLNLTALVDLAHSAETLLDAARSGRAALGQREVDLILNAGDMIGQMIHALEGQPGPSLAQLTSLLGALQHAGRPDAVRDVAAVAPAPASASAQASQAAAPAPVARTAEVGPKPATGAPAPAASSGREDHGDARTAKVDRTVKVSTTRLDMLVDMVGELVIAQSMVLQDPTIQGVASQSLARNIGLVAKITRDLQEASMSLRMVTVKATFQKMARLVRDVAAKAGKQVSLVIQGEDTELDRNVVEQISDPLVHMIRNAIDHGIDPPEERARLGKAPQGRLGLRAYHQGGSIVIEIQDDGRGIDKQRIVAKGVEKGLLPADATVDSMSDAETFGLIFVPGFSTAEKVTDLSGRGVGMDVVRRNIEALRGKIEIDSRRGEGTTFRLRLPLTLAIIDGMVVRIGRERYVVPTLSIEHSFRPSASDMHYLADRGECVRVRGTVLPVHRLKTVFAQQDGLDEITEGILIVVEVDGERSCLFVDEIVGQQQVVIKSLGLQGERVAGVSGGAIMGDGRIALILDLGSLVSTAV